MCSTKYILLIFLVIIFGLLLIRHFFQKLNQVELITEGFNASILADNLSSIPSISGDPVISANSNYVFIAFKSSGKISFPRAQECICCVVAGGGGGGGMYSTYEGPGGGGGGGVGIGSLTFSPNVEYSILVGNGGTGGIGNSNKAGTNGGNSSIVGGQINETANGGGFGGNCQNNQGGGNGGNGGGGCGGWGNSSYGITNKSNGKLSYYGNNGKRGANIGAGGGGGGSGGEGTEGIRNGNGGNGGPGYNWIMNNDVYGGGGGGGGSRNYSNTSGGSGGQGGGGNGGGLQQNVASNGLDNTGGGGGGGWGNTVAGRPDVGVGGKGGSGIVILAIKTYIPNINAQNAMNKYYIQKIEGNQKNQLPNTIVYPGSNNILSFFVDYDGSRNGNWTQLIGITPSSSGSDNRYLAIWLCPNNTTLHIRTSVAGDGNRSILDGNNDCGYSLTLDQAQMPVTRRIDIIGNTNNNSQTYSVYDTIYKYQTRTITRPTKQIGQTTTMPIQSNIRYTEPVYIYSSYNNWNHVSFNVYNLMFITGKQQFDINTVTTSLTDYFTTLDTTKNPL